MNTGLTAREAQTLAQIAQGLSNKEIARAFGISDGTVKIYVKCLLRKFNLHSRLELAARVYQNSQLESRSLRTLLDGVPGLVYRGRNDRNWTMEIISQGCIELTGYSAEHLRGGRHIQFSQLIVAEDAGYVWESVQQALCNREDFSLLYQIRSADGRLRQVFERGRGIYSDSGEVLGLEGAIFEIAAKDVRKAYGAPVLS